MRFVLAMVLTGCGAGVDATGDTVVYRFDLDDMAATGLCDTAGNGSRVCSMRGHATLTYSGPGAVEVRALDGISREGTFDGALVETGSLDGERWLLGPGDSAQATVAACVTCWDGEAVKAGTYDGAALWGVYPCGYTDGGCDPESEPSEVVSANVVAVVE